MKFITTLFLLFVSLVSAAFTQRTENGTLTGRVLDPNKAVIVGATVTATGPDGSLHTVQTGMAGEFSLTLAAGVYTLQVASGGFADLQRTSVVVTGRKATSLDLELMVGSQQTVLTVEQDPPINTDPNGNAGATVLKSNDLKALPDDPAELEAALQALAGPAAGPSGGEIFVDGFSGGRLPPRNSIREIRINQNPYSAEYDRPGFGRIEILTKPGADKWRGEVGTEFEDEAVNSRNPFAMNRPPFQLRNINGNIGGPIVKKHTSFFFDGEKEDIDNNALINAIVLDPSLTPVQFQRSVLSPLKTYEFNSRVDQQFGASNTLVVRFLGSGATTQNAGLGGFDLPSRAYDSHDSDSTLRMTETAILSATAVNETSFQYIRRRSNQTSTDASPTIRVLDAFTGGGANVGNAFNKEDRLELQNSTSLVRNAHLWKFGVRFRHVQILDSSPANFAGTFTFTTLDQYRNTILHVPGSIPTQFTLAGGNPVAGVSRTDVGLYLLDDWRLRPDLTLSFGLRYETQTNISDHGNLAPRLGIAYSPTGNGKTKVKTVYRAGFGIFYDRFSESLTLQTIRFNGTNQQQYIVTNPLILSQPVFTPDGKVTNVPTTAQLAAFAQRPAIRTTSPGLQAPRTAQTAFSVERQLPYNTTLSLTYVFSHSDRLLRSLNVNAPVNGVRPDPSQGNIYQYDSSGRLNQHQILLNFRSNISKRISLFGNYAFGRAKSDTDGPGTFPADQYDLDGEYGDATSDIRHRFVIGGNLRAPLGLSLSPFISFRTGVPFNVTTGFDNNGDTLFTDRPAFAGASELGAVVTKFGTFDPTPEAGDTIIPRNYGRGPSFLVGNLRIAREWTLFAGPKKPKGGAIAQSADAGNRTGTNSPFSTPVARSDDDEEGGRYKLELSVQIRNILNHVNGGAPVGNLSSPLFGESVSLASGFGFGGGRQSGGNRRFRWEAKFSF